MHPAQHPKLFLFSALCFAFLTGERRGVKKKSPVYSEFPSPFKLIMGSGTEAFTMWNINYYFGPKS